MALLPREEFVRLLRHQSPDEFTAFVAALWQSRGWEVDIDGRAVVTDRTATDERRVLAVSHDARRLHRPSSIDRDDITDVVTSGRAPGRAREVAREYDARLIDADDLYDRVCYGLDRDEAGRLLDRHLEKPPIDWWTVRTWGAAALRRAFSVRSGVVVAVALAVVVLASGFWISGFAPGAIPGSSANDAGETTSTPVNTLTPISSPTPTSTSSLTTQSSRTVPPPIAPWIGNGSDAWRLFHGGPSHAGWQPNTTGPVDPRVVATFDTREAIFSSPAVVDGTVYIGSNNGRVYALDAVTLDVRWTRQLGDAVTASPAVVNDTVYVGTIAWRPSGSGTRFRASIIVHALSTAGDEPRWAGELASAPVLSPKPAIVSSPTVVNDTVYVGGMEKQVYAFDAVTGAKQWVVETNGSVVSSPAVVNDTVYVGDGNGTVYALAADNGSVRWTATAGKGIISSPAVVNGTVFLGDLSGGVYAFDATTGAKQWVVETNESVVSSPAVVDRTVYIGDGNGTVYALAADNGSVRWTATAGEAIISSPAVANGTVYLGSLSGGVYAFNAATGAKQWVVETNGSVVSSPAVTDEILYVGTNNGTVYAIGDPVTACEQARHGGEHVHSRTYFSKCGDPTRSTGTAGGSPRLAASVG